MKQKSLKLSLLILCGWVATAALSITTTAVADCSSNECSTSCSESCDNSPCAQANNMFLPRAFSSYSMRDINQRQAVCDELDHKLNFALNFEYMQNFGNCSDGCKNLGSRPFWSGDNTLTIGNNDGRAQLDAYQLGMGNVEVDENGIAGVIKLDPRIQHVGADLMMFYQQSKDERGLYFKVQAPVVAMSIDPRLTEERVAVPNNAFNFTQTTTGVGGTAITYQFEEYPVPLSRQQTVSEAFYGAVIKDGGVNGNLNKPIRLRHGRVSPCKHTEIRLADLSTSLGYNVFANDKGFVGVAFKATFPTGNVARGDYMLEPIVGRGGAWGIGGEFSADYKVWESECSPRCLTIRMQGEALHLMHGRTPNFRTFDLKLNGKGSKYMLIQQYYPTYSQANPNTQIMSAQRIQPAANLTTLPVFSKIAVEGSFALLLDFRCNNWNLGIGGEFWGRSHECLSIDLCSTADRRHESLNDYAVIGRQLSAYAVNGQVSAATGAIVPFDTFYAEPAAKINKSQPAVVLVGAPGTVPVPPGTSTLAVPTTLPDGIKDASLPENRIPADFNEALDIAGAAAGRAFTGKVTGNVGYTWSEREHMPSLMLMGGAEFTNKTNNAVQYWSVGLQGALNF